jgi:hypothetical protein
MAQIGRSEEGQSLFFREVKTGNAGLPPQIVAYQDQEETDVKGNGEVPGFGIDGIDDRLETGKILDQEEDYSGYETEQAQLFFSCFFHSFLPKSFLESVLPFILIFPFGKRQMLPLPVPESPGKDAEE